MLLPDARGSVEESGAVLCCGKIQRYGDIAHGHDAPNARYSFISFLYVPRKEIHHGSNTAAKSAASWTETKVIGGRIPPYLNT